jgi:EmrB/QacA subfamily drug resistance transporter
MLGGFSLVLFVINELMHKDPLLDLRLFKIWPFTLSIFISSATNIAMFGGVFLLPLFLQNLQGYSAMQTGIIMFPGALATGIMMPISGRLFDKYGAKIVVIPGLIILALATYELSKITIETSSAVVMILIAFRGVGLGLSMMPITTAGMNAVPIALVARASALSNVLRQVAGSVGLTMLTTILQKVQSVSYTRISEQVNWFNPGSAQLFTLMNGLFTQYGLSPGENRGASMAAVYGLVQKYAFLQGINDTLFVTTLIALVTVPLAFLIRDTRQKKPLPEGGGAVE